MSETMAACSPMVMQRGLPGGERRAGTGSCGSWWSGWSPRRWLVCLPGWLLPGLVVTGAGAALEAAALLGLVNAPAIVVALVLTVVNAGLTTLLTLDDEDVYYRRVIRRAARRVRPEGVGGVPGRRRRRYSHL